eukprot:Hpha_TRINITY_DN13468_c0_g1::TRINITY_DN13468_c0_g1_i1::g.130919::m.130919
MAEGEDPAILKLLVENDTLLRAVDDTLADRSAPHGATCNTGTCEGIGHGEVKFDAEDLRSGPEFAELLAKRRGHLHRKRFHATDVADSLAERLANAAHTSAAATAVENKAKAVGNRAVAKVGGLIDGATAAFGSFGGKKKEPKEEAPEATPQPAATMEIKEVNLDWGGKYPPVGYGEQMHAKHFSHLPKGYLDGAGFGCIPAAVLEAHDEWDKTNQTNPVMWRFKHLNFRIADAEMGLASELGIDPNDLKLTSSAEMSLCSVVESIPWLPGDGILLVTDEAVYVRKAVDRAQQRYSVHIHVIAPPAPFSAEEIKTEVAQWCSTLTEQDAIKYKLAIIPEVAFKTGIKIKTTVLTEELHKKGIAVYVDGTMAVGNRESPEVRGCDWYGASLSNWMYCEPGAAFLICHPLKQPCTNTLTVSYFDRGPANAEGFNSSFEKEFSYAGLQDFATWCSIYHALEFVSKCCTPEKSIRVLDTIGKAFNSPWSNARKYTHGLAEQVVEKVTAAWGTSPLQTDKDYAGMPVIPLPGGQGFGDDVAASITVHCATRPEDRGGPLSVRIVSVLMKADGGSPVPTLCARFTCQVFNAIEEYVAAAEYIKELQQSPGYSGVTTGLENQELAVQMVQTFI